MSPDYIRAAVERLTNPQSGSATGTRTGTDGIAETPERVRKHPKKNGAPGGNRTPDPRLRRPMLYPTELRARADLRYTAQALSGSVKVPSKFHSADRPRSRLLTEDWYLLTCQPFHSLQEVRRSQVTIPLHHAQGAPATEYLNRPKVDPRHDEPAGERVAVAMPRISI